MTPEGWRGGFARETARREMFGMIDGVRCCRNTDQVGTRGSRGREKHAVRRNATF